MLPENQNNELAKSNPNEEFAAIVGRELSMLHACLKTFGKPFSAEIIRGFVMVLSGSKATPNEFRSAIAEYLAKPAAEFPTPGEFVTRLLDLRTTREQAAMMERTAERIKEDEESQWREWRIEHYGTANPTIEEVKERMKSNPFMAVVLGGTEGEDEGRFKG